MPHYKKLLRGVQGGGLLEKSPPGRRRHSRITLAFWGEIGYNRWPMKNCCLILILIFCMAFSVKAQETEKYRWPLDINNGYSSSFQEFRSNHFHAGMDLRTFQRTGYPVYAIADGLIYKIRMVKRGSGRSLYLKHDDGNTSIYFHLDRFEKKLEDLLKRVQRLKGRKYFGNYFLEKPLRYQQGQLIAYAGETGSGFPHLHLEIRDPHQSALNPFQLVKLPSRDHNPPVLRGLLFRNRGSAPFNGKIGEQYITLKKENYLHHHYVSTQPVVITGPFDVVLNTRDISDSGRYVAPYEISVSIDEHHYFNLRFDRFRWVDNNQLGFVYDMFYSSSSSYYFNLFFQEGFSLESQNISLRRIIETLDYGEHKLKLRVKDNFNNVSTGLVTFYKVEKPGLVLSDCFVEGKEIELGIEALEAESADEITIALKDKKENTIYTGQLKYRTISERKEFSLKGSFKNVYFIDFNFIKKGIVYSRKRFLLKDKWLQGIKDIDFDTYVNRDEVFINLKNSLFSAGNLRLTIVQGAESKEIAAESSGDSIYFRFKPLNFKQDVLLRFAVLKEGQKVAEIQKKLVLIYLKQDLRQYFKYEEFGAEFDTRSVYEPKVLQLEEKNYKSEYPVLSRQISLSPYHFPFLDKVHYTFKKNLPNPEQVGIFRYDFKNKKWDYRYTTYNSAGKTYKRRILSSGVYALMRDIYPPRIYFKRPRTKYKKYLKRLVVNITDKGKGVNDNTLKVQLNGKPVDCEYDPDWRSVFIGDLKHIKGGKNLLKVEVKDYAGYRTAKTFSFHLK